jgi:hypothetical protein
MQEYKSKDFYLSGFLLCKGIPLIDTDRENGYTVFTFEDNAALRALISNYYRSQTTVDPVLFSQTLRQLKGVMHSLVSTQNHENNNNERKEQ